MSPEAAKLTCQSGRRIFYFVAANIGVADYDLLAYHAFQVMFDATEPFDIIFDMTGFAAANDLPLPWLKRMIQMCPPAIIASVHVSLTLGLADLDHRSVQPQHLHQATTTPHRLGALASLRQCSKAPRVGLPTGRSAGVGPVRHAQPARLDHAARIQLGQGVSPGLCDIGP